MSPRYAREWISKADADRLAAERALRDAGRHRGQADIACFHAQQCAEKHLKAVLAQSGALIPKTHDLAVLAELAKPLGFPSASLRRILLSLNRYAVTVRYPGRRATLRDARAAVRGMRQVAKATANINTRQRGPNGPASGGSGGPDGAR